MVGRPGDADAGRAQANPPISMALNAGFDLREAKCNRCRRISPVSLRGLDRPAVTPVWKLEAALYCEPCSENRNGAPAGSHSAADLRPAGSGARPSADHLTAMCNL